MTKKKFAELFATVIERAIAEAERSVGHNLSNHVEIKLFGASYSGQTLNLPSVIDVLYLDEHRFYKLIDVAVMESDKYSTYLFVRVSDHEPGTWEDTYDPYNGMGPFKLLIPSEVIVRS